jgi:hypothetical protein
LLEFAVEKFTRRANPAKYVDAVHDARFATDIMVHANGDISDLSDPAKVVRINLRSASERVVVVVEPVGVNGLGLVCPFAFDDGNGGVTDVASGRKVSGYPLEHHFLSWTPLRFSVGADEWFAVHGAATHVLSKGTLATTRLPDHLTSDAAKPSPVVETTASQDVVVFTTNDDVMPSGEKGAREWFTKACACAMQMEQHAALPPAYKRPHPLDGVNWDTDPVAMHLRAWLYTADKAYAASTDEMRGAELFGFALNVSSHGTETRYNIEGHIPQWPPVFLVPVERSDAKTYAPMPDDFAFVSDEEMDAYVKPETYKMGSNTRWYALAMWPSRVWLCSPASSARTAALAALGGMASEDVCDNPADFAAGLPLKAIQRLERTDYGAKWAVGFKVSS